MSNLSPLGPQEAGLLLERVEGLEAAIKKHNAECDFMCNPYVCGYDMYKRRCPTCPKDLKIDVPNPI